MECIICLDELSDSENFIITECCKQYIHIDCIQKWVKQNINTHFDNPNNNNRQYDKCFYCNKNNDIIDNIIYIENLNLIKNKTYSESSSSNNNNNNLTLMQEFNIQPLSQTTQSSGTSHTSYETPQSSLISQTSATSQTPETSQIPETPQSSQTSETSGTSQSSQTTETSQSSNILETPHLYSDTVFQITNDSESNNTNNNNGNINSQRDNLLNHRENMRTSFCCNCFCVMIYSSIIYCLINLAQSTENQPN
jgi:hypothetical protein